MTEKIVTETIEAIKALDPERVGVSIEDVIGIDPGMPLVGVMGILRQAEHEGLIVKEGDIYRWTE